MKDIIFTIGRSFGSGGREVGELLAKKLGIPFYDKELLVEAAKESEYTEKIFETFDEQPVKNTLYSMAMGNFPMFGETMPISMQANLAQMQTIQKVASENKSCVIVGRCSDFALREYDNIVNVFITADPQIRIERICKRAGVGEKSAAAEMKRIDKARAGYYNYYTENRWGDAKNYDLCLDSGKIGVEGCVSVILAYAELI
ncbi:MAG: cytidylate kinase-like family protein [Eubacterium sp.]|nr:cytidylate kinase-like family protein [Eubacterium sp.]